MKVKVKLFAMLRSKLPPDSNGEDTEIDVAEGTTASQIIDLMEIPPQLAHLVMINGYHLLPDEVENRVLKPGEVLAIFPPIAGGQ